MIVFERAQGPCSGSHGEWQVDLGWGPGLLCPYFPLLYTDQKGWSGTVKTVTLYLLWLLKVYFKSFPAPDLIWVWWPWPCQTGESYSYYCFSYRQDDVRAAQGYAPSMSRTSYSTGSYDMLASASFPTAGSYGQWAWDFSLDRLEEWNMGHRAFLFCNHHLSPKVATPALLSMILAVEGKRGVMSPESSHLYFLSIEQRQYSRLCLFQS